VIELAGGQYVLNLIHDITERKQRQRELEAIAAMAMALRAAPTRAEMLPVIVHQVFNLLKADGAALAIPEPATGGAVIAFAHGEWVDRTGAHFPAEAGVTGHVLTTGRAYLNNDATNDPHNVRPDLVGDLRALACVPLIAQDQAIGALWVGRKTVIAEEELRLLIAISDIAANALLRAQIVETLEQRVAERTRELAQANERLEELDRLKSKFVSDVSHELRTPVAVLKLHAELLEHGRPEKREQYVKVIGEQADRQAQLVEDILNLSRLELGADKVQFAPVALNTLVSQIVEAHQPAVEAAGLTLTFMPDPDLPPVRGEYNQLAQVITNLIANAINYMPAGRVQVSTGLKDRQVVVEVRDTGMGIASEDLPHLFERFYRGQRTQHIRGTGLGLAIVKEIVDLHGGSIEVESEVGVGSTFRVCLPIMERGA
jgi:signal transduction histidine kinase